MSGMVAQWLAHLPHILMVLSLNMGSDVGNFMSKHAPLNNVICKDDIKQCIDLWLQIGITGGLF